jgi:hypothetical protein
MKPLIRFSIISRAKLGSSIYVVIDVSILDKAVMIVGPASQNHILRFMTSRIDYYEAVEESL